MLKLIDLVWEDKEFTNKNAVLCRNLDSSVDFIGSAASRQPFSRSNHYFEVQILDYKGGDVGMVMGAMFDNLLMERFPIESKDRKGGSLDG